MTTPDIVTRLRRWAIATDAVPASDLMDEAADEIERLRLTDAERSLLEMLADHPVTHEIMRSEVATLRGLLERTK